MPMAWAQSLVGDDKWHRNQGMFLPDLQEERMKLREAEMKDDEEGSGSVLVLVVLRSSCVLPLLSLTI